MKPLMIFTLMVMSASAFAQTRSVSVQENPFFYRIEKDGKVSFLLGTMHAGIPLQSFPKEISEIFDRCQTVAFEADREKFLQENKQAIHDSAKLPAGKKLDQMLHLAAVAKLRELFNDNIFLYKPWVVADEISHLMEKKLTITDGVSWSFDDAIDGVLLKRAQARGQQSIQFLDDTSRKLNEFEEAMTAADLERILSYSDPVGHQVACARLVQQSYLSGDESGFDRYFAQDCDTPKFLEIMKHRTASWAPKLKSMFDEGSACVAFGAGHLYGPAGALTQLEKEGFKVTRLTYRTVGTDGSVGSSPASR